MKIRLVTAELLHAGRQTDRQTKKDTDIETDKYDKPNGRFTQFY